MTAFREAVVDLGAIGANVAHLRAVVGTPHLMAVVKANAYGHGALPVARAALAAGADWLGVADVAEALQLRTGGIDSPILAWLHDPDVDFAPAISQDIDLGLSSQRQLRQAADVGHLPLVRGRALPARRKEYWIRPEQSKALGPVAPQR